MNPPPPLPRLPYVLLLAMSLVSFGGPFLILGVVRGGESPRWPPDRPIEWAVIGVILVLLMSLFAACVTIRIWYRPVRLSNEGASPSEGEAASHQADLHSSS